MNGNLINLLWASIARQNPGLPPSPWRIIAAELLEASSTCEDEAITAWAAATTLDLGSGVENPPTASFIHTDDEELREAAREIVLQAVVVAFQALSGLRAGSGRRFAHDQGGRFTQLMLSWAKEVVPVSLSEDEEFFSERKRIGKLVRLAFSTEDSRKASREALAVAVTAVVEEHYKETEVGRLLVERFSPEEDSKPSPLEEVFNSIEAD